MNITQVLRAFRTLPRFLKDNSLTRKALLNAFASALDYSANIIVAFVVTPFMVSGLGNYYYGAWQILMRLVGYISPASGRPTQALKFTLAKEQNSIDYQLKRSYVGSTLEVLLFFLPLMGVLGALLTWFVPEWIRTPVAFVWNVRVACALLVLNLIASTLVAVPHSILEGENKGYKRMGMSTVLVFFGGGLTWAALYLNFGIIGVAGAALLSSIIQFIFFMQVVRQYSPWFGIAKPSRFAVREFLKLSWWFMAWNLIMNLMMASDVVVLGLLNSVESVTNYSLSKYAPETAITVIAMMVFGILPGLGGIIGSGDLEKAAKVRGEIMLFTWLVVTVLGTGILLLNRTFIGMWVGPDHFVGGLPNLLIVLVVLQFVLIRNDANVIDLTLRLSRKVFLGAISVTVSILCACILVYFFDLGIIGVSVGIMLGRLILTVAYPIMIGNLLKIKLAEQLKVIFRPALVTTVLFLSATWFENRLATQSWQSVSGWILFLLVSGATALGVFVLAFLSGFSTMQQKAIIHRIRSVISASTR